MTTYYMSTKNTLDERLVGPVDPKNGFPTVHKNFMCEAETMQDAEIIFAKRFPGNVLSVYVE